MSIYIVKNIEWDVDGNKSLVKILPRQIEVSVPDDVKMDEDIDEYISNFITNKTGFCHYGFTRTLDLQA